MRYLLDTHVFIWFTGKNAMLPSRIREVIENSDNVFVSIASFWEMTIKISVKKLTLPRSITETMRTCKEELNFSILDIRDTHLEILKNLPLAHKDPFDRMIISQALAENMTLISADKLVKSYPVHRLWEE